MFHLRLVEPYDDSWERVNKSCCCCPQPKVDTSMPPYMAEVKIVPKLLVKPSNSEYHPCESNEE